jgi:hypothetical protein
VWLKQTYVTITHLLTYRPFKKEEAYQAINFIDQLEK